MLLHNETDEQVKVCIYRTAAPLDVTPCEGGVVFLEPFESQPWQPAPAENAQKFDVRFFNPEVFDRLLARESDVPRERRVRLYRESKAYKTDVAISG
jgi:hypothetical protein